MASIIEYVSGMVCVLGLTGIVALLISTGVIGLDKLTVHIDDCSRSEVYANEQPVSCMGSRGSR